MERMKKEEELAALKAAAEAKRREKEAVEWEEARKREILEAKYRKELARELPRDR